MKKTILTLLTISTLSANVIAAETVKNHSKTIENTNTATHYNSYQPSNVYSSYENYTNERNERLDSYLNKNKRFRQEKEKLQTERQEHLMKQSFYSEEEREAIKRRNQHILEEGQSNFTFSKGKLVAEQKEVAYTEQEINDFYTKQNRSPNVNNWAKTLSKVGISPSVTKHKQKTLSKIEFEEWANQMLGLMNQEKQVAEVPQVIKATVGTVVPTQTLKRDIVIEKGKVIYSNQKPDAKFSVIKKE